MKETMYCYERNNVLLTFVAKVPEAHPYSSRAISMQVTRSKQTAHKR